MNLKINRKEVIDLKISVIPSNRPLTLSDKLFCNSKPDFLPLFIDLLRFCKCEHFKSMSTGFLIIWNTLYYLFISRSSHLQMFCKRDVLKISQSLSENTSAGASILVCFPIQIKKGLRLFLKWMIVTICTIFTFCNNRYTTFTLLKPR